MCVGGGGVINVASHNMYTLHIPYNVKCMNFVDIQESVIEEGYSLWTDLLNFDHI